MTASNVITKPANDLTDEEFLSRDIELIYDAVTDIYDLSKYDGIRLDSLNSMLRLLREKMANAFNQIESNLSMYQFVEAIRHAQTEQEKNEIVDRFKSAKEVTPRRTYE
ncbi:hypothetical protein [Cellvibrio sp. NN19]|uniref:hypothetical protein n=1 Tax=Cellvibrio chitinivorans TaxID=3102792 RepID=UPI002B4147A6|nr:hypothetical protein [Cellvibrio sp. NN19]